MIFGLGTDIVETDRIGKSVKNINFLNKVFTHKEIALCQDKANASQKYAARFAGKEAFMKALGTGWRKNIKFDEIEILNDELGKPYITLYGIAKEIAKENKITNVYISLSHIKEYATAVVILEH